MPKFSIRMTDDDFKKMERLRGDKSISEFVRSAVLAEEETFKNDAKEFQQLLSDVAYAKHRIASLATKKDLLSLAAFFTEIASIANPPAYANYRDKIQQLYNDLNSKIENKG